MASRFGSLLGKLPEVWLSLQRCALKKHFPTCNTNGASFAESVTRNCRPWTWHSAREHWHQMSTSTSSSRRDASCLCKAARFEWQKSLRRVGSSGSSAGCSEGCTAGASVMHFQGLQAFEGSVERSARFGPRSVQAFAFAPCRIHELLTS